MHRHVAELQPQQASDILQNIRLYSDFDVKGSGKAAMAPSIPELERAADVQQLLLV